MDITLFIKTFERPECPRRLVASVRERFPDMPIIVVDDSREANPIEGVEYIHTDFDIGVSKGRNMGARLTKTKYFMTVDDDNYLTDKCDIKRAIDILEENNLDLIGVEEVNCSYFGLLVNNGDTVGYMNGNRGVAQEVTFYDFVPALYITPTETAQKFPWDETLKMGEHFAFFHNYLGKLKIGYTDVVSFGHAPLDNDFYAPHRARALDYVKQYMKAKGIKKRVDLHGNTIEI